MRRSNSHEELPQYPEYLIPVLVHYGFEDGITEDLGARPIRCAFHGDSTPSATVNTADGWYTCHTHGDCPRGNAAQIVMQKEGLAYHEAVERAESIAREYGTEVSSTRSTRRRGGSRGGRSSGARVRRSWS